MYLIIDTETTGLPTGKSPPYFKTNLFDTCRIVQMSFMLCDKDFNELSFHDFIINSENKFNVTGTEFHGITNEISLKSKTTFTDVIKEFVKVLKDTDTIIAHNIDFDVPVIKSELCRLNMNDVITMINNKNMYCTMVETRELVKIKKDKNDSYKYPSLAELYKFTFGKDIENAHNSKYDVINLHAIIKKIKLRR